MSVLKMYNLEDMMQSSKFCTKDIWETRETCGNLYVFIGVINAVAGPFSVP
jgi:hypothetical protein